MKKRQNVFRWAGEISRRSLKSVGRVWNFSRRNFVHLALPPLCAACGKDIERPGNLALCHTCEMVFAIPAGPLCMRCAAPVPQASIRETGCVYCEETSFRFHSLAALGVYRGELQSLVVRMKNQSGEALAIAAGKLLGQRIRELAWPDPPELVAAVPMYWSRRLWRGMNAAAILAESVACALNLPLALDLLRCVRNVPRQASLTPARRRHNMRHVFQASAAYNLREAHVLVIDDVLTTGATANAVAQALRLAEAKTVSMGVVARGIGLT